MRDHDMEEKMNSAELKEEIRKDIELTRFELKAREYALSFIEQYLLNHPEPKGLDILFDPKPVARQEIRHEPAQVAQVFYRHVCPSCKKILVNRHAKMNCINDKTLMISNKVIPRGVRGKYKKR
jgi:hypothetical protein